MKYCAPFFHVILFHTYPSQFIISHEYGRLGTRGSMDGLLSGGVIGLPPVLNFGSEEIQAKIVPEVLSGKKFICLAISEAFAGSDVAGLQTTATKDGDYWIVTGTKKWITNGHFAHYFTTACKTDVSLMSPPRIVSSANTAHCRKDILSYLFLVMRMCQQRQSRRRIHLLQAPHT